MAKYDDKSVFLPGRGAVLIGPVGTEMPSLDEVTKWVKGGMAGDLGKTMSPLGYTSIDDLPKFDVDTDGGEKKGAWENDALRTTQVKTTETITVTPIQWSGEAMQHRFGKAQVDAQTGKFSVPAAYSASEVALTVVVLDGETPLVFHFYKAASSPDGGIEPKADDFLGFGIKYTILNHQSKPKFDIAHAGLKTGATSS
ncbi:hypothetical protein [Corynebacterium resistens]|uniref:phage tail tube protein n=1 Tax=Corynebacterium resistens TaxID=258224 RepID=UPI002354DE77|nr:hypothetical protein [Corynebacterium resistens]